MHTSLFLSLSLSVHTTYYLPTYIYYVYTYICTQTDVYTYMRLAPTGPGASRSVPHSPANNEDKKGYIYIHIHTYIYIYVHLSLSLYIHIFISVPHFPANNEDAQVIYIQISLSLFLSSCIHIHT